MIFKKKLLGVSQRWHKQRSRIHCFGLDAEAGDKCVLRASEAAVGRTIRALQVAGQGDEGLFGTLCQQRKNRQLGGIEFIEAGDG